MCFSAGASFTAGVVLSAVGVASIKRAETSTQIFFGSIPLLFAIQQISEGVLWLALSDPAYKSLGQLATYNFLFFAQVVWPAWVPFAVLKMEPGEGRTIGKVMVVIGALIALYLFYCLINYPVEARLMSNHISYDVDYPRALSGYGSILYVLATITPPFFSKIKYMWMLGTTVLISYLFTAIFYTDYVVSVWCFFASIISIAVYFIMNQMTKDNRLSRNRYMSQSPLP